MAINSMKSALDFQFLFDKQTQDPSPPPFNSVQKDKIIQTMRKAGEEVLPPTEYGLKKLGHCTSRENKVSTLGRQKVGTHPDVGVLNSGLRPEVR